MKKQSARTMIASKKAEREAKKAYNTAGVNTSTTKGIERQWEQMPTPPVDSVKDNANSGKTPLTNNTKGGKSQ